MANPSADLTTSDLIEVRRSGVHGLGVFAAKRIPKGARIIEYVGERVSHDEADRRYEEKDANDSHTFLFIVDSKTVIDAGTDGARRDRVNADAFGRDFLRQRFHEHADAALRCRIVCMARPRNNIVYRTHMKYLAART